MVTSNRSFENKMQSYSALLQIWESCNFIRWRLQTFSAGADFVRNYYRTWSRGKNYCRHLLFNIVLARESIILFLLYFFLSFCLKRRDNREDKFSNWDNFTVWEGYCIIWKGFTCTFLNGFIFMPDKLAKLSKICVLLLSPKFTK